MPSSHRIVRNLLNSYWLRPETALWRACDIKAMEGFRFESPSLDLGCGDGLFSFIRAAGELSPHFDAFQAVSSLDRYFSKVDVYDSFNKEFAAEIVRPTEYRIDVGVDHKPNLLRKAASLGLYGKLLEADANKRLGFPDESFRSIFSNIVYWLDSPEMVLKEIARLLQPGGRACVLLPNASLRDGSFYWTHYRCTGDERFKFLELLDRGQLADNIKQIRNGEQWKASFRDAGLQVLSHRLYLSRAVVQIWDIGLRPLFPVLHKLVSIADPEKLPTVKKEWVDVFESLLLPLVEMDPASDQMNEPAFHCFVLGR